MNVRQWFVWVGFAVVSLSVAGCGGGGDTVRLTGSGATFPAPVYQKWFKDYNTKHPNVQIDYQSVGSGQGVQNFIDQKVDFGASDAAMTPEEIAQVKSGVVLVPMTAGAIVFAYNLEGVDELKLSREAYVAILLKKVTSWDDPLIKASNEGVQLPAEPINVVTRSDSSGTTYVFTKHLCAVSKEFEEIVGNHKQPTWPAGTGAKGNEGVTNALKTTPNSIGYVEYGYAVQQKLNMASLENKSGKFIKPTIESAQAALAGAKFDENLIAWVPDPDGADSYPIETFTWLLCYKQYDDKKKAQALKDVITYCLDEGQKSSVELGYIPLPKEVVEKCKQALEKIGG